jgi:tyrosinase
MAGLILRKSVDALMPNELQVIRDAYGRAQQIFDNRGYNYYAGFHGVPNWFCWHHDRSWRANINARLFLPWHRAYLMYFERTIRDQSDPNSQLGLPWWDWASATSHFVGAPRAFSAATVNGQANPLFRARIYAPFVSPPINRMTRRFPGNPAQLPTTAQVNNLLSLSQFNDFSTQLEDIHDFVHGWTGGNNGSVGGDMGNLGTAAWDPLFWSHHCMIDRLWYLWQLRQGINNVPPELLNMVLQPFAVTVRDVLSINSLGYEYAVSSVVFQ